MRILDRQRYWAFAKAYVICFTSLVGLYIIIDLFSNVDEFYKGATGTGGLLKHVGRYYLVRVPAFFDRLCGVIMIMAAIFTVTWMQKNNELLAMLAAGVSTKRAIVPVIVSAVGVAGLAIANQEWVIPEVAEDLQKTPDDDGQKKVRVWSRYDVNDVLIHSSDFGYRAEQTVEEFNVTLPESRFGRQMQVHARQARYIPAEARRLPHRGGWLLRGAELTPPDAKPDGAILAVVSADDLRRFPAPRGGDKAAAGPAYFLRSDETFSSVTRSRLWYQFAPTLDLLRYLNEPKSRSERNEIAVFLHGRNVRPLGSIILLFLSLPLVLGGEGRNMFVNLGMSLGTSALFYGMMFFAQYLGYNAVFSGELAAWMPIIAFGTFAAARWDTIRT